jgi:rhodanese-related sulfurtransferase
MLTPRWSRSRSTGQAALLLVVALLSIALAACASPASSAPAVRKLDAGAAVSMLSTRTVIDVRTPAEYAAGHIAGARNIDVQAPDFASAIATLDKGAAYLVYCHSGRRSAIAAAQMAAAGFTDIVDGGGMADLVAAGAPTR